MGTFGRAGQQQSALAERELDIVLHVGLMLLWAKGRSRKEGREDMERDNTRRRRDERDLR